MEAATREARACVRFSRAGGARCRRILVCATGALLLHGARWQLPDADAASDRDRFTNTYPGADAYANAHPEPDADAWGDYNPSLPLPGLHVVRSIANGQCDGAVV